MIDTLRMARRPAPGFAWRALALYVGPALLLAATVLPIVLLRDRLPRSFAPPYQMAGPNFLTGAEVLGLWLLVAWLFVVVIGRTTRHPNRRMLWELWIPLLYGLGGFVVALAAQGLALNLDRPYADRGDGTGLLGLPATMVAALAGIGVGLVLGRRAAATEPVPRPRARAVWISDVVADRRWWLMQGTGALLACAVVALPSVLFGSWAEALRTDTGLLCVLALLAAWASRGHVSISPSGLRAYYGHVPLLGLQLAIDQIASVDVDRVRLLRSAAGWQCLSHLALRDGPALVVRTRNGGRHVVTVPDAEGAAAALRAWLPT